MKIGVCFVSQIVALGMIALSSVHVSGNDYKIVPGERVGDVSLAMSIDDIKNLLGQPSRVRQVSGAVGFQQTEWEWEGPQIRLYQSMDSGRVNDIRTYWLLRRSNSYRTDKSVAIGATESQVRQAHGDAGCLFREGATWRQLAWRDQGLFFYIWTSPDLPSQILNRVAEIGIHRPNPAGAPAPPGSRPCS